MQQMPFHASSGTLAQGVGGPSLNDLVAQSSAFFNFNAGNLLPLHSQLQGGGGNITLGGSSGLPPNVPFPNGVSLFGPSFGQMFPDLNALDTRTTGSVDESLLEMSGQQAGPSRSGGDGGSLSGRTGSAYASRHQAAEQRRRTRINERLDLLRKMVPHTERSNTACFLEEVLKYIDALKSRVVELESTLQAVRTGKTLPSSHVGGPSVSRAVPKAESTHGSGQPAPQTGYSIQQQLQQQQQMMLQQQHEAAILAMQEDQQQQMAILAMQQLKNQKGVSQPRSSGQLPDLAGMLGLKTLESEAYGQCAVDGPESAKVGRVNLGAGPSTPSTSLHLPPVPQLQMPVLDVLAVPQQASDGTEALPASEVTDKDRDGSMTTSPTTSGESGVPLKKRKVLLL